MSDDRKDNSQQPTIEPPELAILEQLNALPNFVVMLTPFAALCVLGNLQLASRHPLNTGEAAWWSSRFARELTEYLSQAGPLVEALAKMGWDVKYDVKPGEVPVGITRPTRPRDRR